ncbi:DNA damage-regulated autophagy modulator protein 2-like isoform X2 [Argopecten irradians]|uniref:DNA damage-regulated autophagy modulator protein 2-like isoform X2 n=1 Tax=Argopecten irradians TaxID=31199 RepID=UPI00371F75F7
MSTSRVLISRCHWDTGQQAAQLPTWTGDNVGDQGGEEETAISLLSEEEGRETEVDEYSPLLRKERNQDQHKQRDIMILGDRLHVVTVITAIYVPVSFIITYSIAVANDHVEAGFPYISDTGTLPPESCIFGQLLNFGALIAAWNVYIRYKQIRATYAGVNRPGILRANTVGFILGLLTATGVSIVGNFQETNVIAVHILGAFMAFGIGALYCFVQTGMSFKMPEVPGSTLFINKVRILLCVLDVMFFISMLVATYLAGVQNEHDLKWEPHEPGYAEHLVATISEWLMAIFIVMFFVTFYKEFSKFRLTSPDVVFDIKPDFGNDQQNNTDRTTATEFMPQSSSKDTGAGALP